jgi:CRP-like cAMP-binding protein
MPNSPPGNRLLSALPPADQARLTARMTDVTFGHKETVYLPGGPLDYVYFPRSGMLSATVVMADGTSAEVAVIGREGMAGVSSCLGATRCPEDVYCQIAPCVCGRLPAADFVAAVERGGPVREAAHAYVRAALTASARMTACNALHPVDERAARWLLMCHDRVGADEFPLTHEFMAVMLGVRRATVTTTAASLQSAGVIRYRQGRVTVLDRAALEDAACECYRAVREPFEAAAG